MCYSSDSLEQSFFLLVRRVKRTRHLNDHTRFAARALYALSSLTLKKKRGCSQSTPFLIAKYCDDTKHGSKSGVSRIIRESWQHNLVPRVLPYPPCGVRDRERVSLSLYRSIGRVGENPRNEVVDSTSCPPLQKMAKSANYQYFHFFKTFQKALCTFDCKAVCIFAYSSTREQSNKRSETRLKTVTETGARR